MRFPIRWKLLLSIGLPILVVYVAMIVGVLTHLQRAARQSVERRMTETAERYAGTIDASMRELAEVARSTASFMETAGWSGPAPLFAQLRANVARNPLCYGAAIAFEPFLFDREVRLFAPYVHRDGADFRSIDIAEEAYDYTELRWQWYDEPRRTGRPGWTAPYFDEGAGGILMSTFSAPFFREGRLVGVTTVDIALEQLERTVGAAFPDDQRFFVVTASGQYVFHPDRGRIMRSSLFAVADDEDRPDLRQLAEAMTTLGSGVRVIDTERGPEWVFFAPVASAEWSIGATIPEREALAGIRDQVIWFATILAATLLLMGLSIWVVSGRITRPLIRLTEAVREVADGDLEARAGSEDRQDEVGDLSRGFNTMRRDLKQLIRQRTEKEAAIRDALIFSLAKLAESRDNDTGQHLERICRYVEIIAEELGRDRDEIDAHWVRTIAITAALHDIGKVGVPDAVLLKPGRLTDEERIVIQKHTTIGGDALLAIKRRWNDDTFLRTATEIAFAHHERWDGTGYPFGLSEDDIALSARIVAVADVYDALTSKRVYKEGMSHEEACRIIVEGAGTQFDPAIVEIFGRVAPRVGEVAAELHDEPPAS